MQTEEDKKQQRPDPPVWCVGMITNFFFWAERSRVRDKEVRKMRRFNPTMEKMSWGWSEGSDEHSRKKERVCVVMHELFAVDSWANSFCQRRASLLYRPPTFFGRHSAFSRNKRLRGIITIISKNLIYLTDQSSDISIGFSSATAITTTSLHVPAPFTSNP